MPPLLQGEQSFRNLPFFRRIAARLLLRMIIWLMRADQIEVIDWSNSKLVALEFLSNTGVVIAAVSVLMVSKNEEPSMPLRLWVVGYAALCLQSVASVVAEHKKRGEKAFDGESG